MNLNLKMRWKLKLVTIFLIATAFTKSSCQQVSPYFSQALQQLVIPEYKGGGEVTEHKKWGQGLVQVTKVIDGDTFWINDGSKDIKVRFIGIDAPESRNTGRKKIGYYGAEAKEYVTSLTENKWVRLEVDVRELDRYQRLLAYVYLEDGTFLNAHLVAHGYAVVDTHPPNVKYADVFVELQKEAREEGRGLWGNAADI